MAAEELTVRGLTGVDMTLRIAGPGTRAYAFLIDWHIRLLLALAWIVLVWLIGRSLGRGTHSGPGSTPFALVIGLPAALIYLLYHPILELAMRGRTPGKRMAGARIVTREGATPGAGALLMRNLFRLVDSLPFFYLVGLVCCLITDLRVRIGDFAAGTVLVLDAESEATKSLERFGLHAQQSRLAAGAAALVQELLDRWQELDGERRITLARALLARLDVRSDAQDVGHLEETALRARLRSLLHDSP